MTQNASPSSSEQVRLLRPNWATMLSLLATIGAAGAGTLHIIGLTRHRVYLDYWGINANLFPKTTDWLLLNGYYGVIDRFVVVINTLQKNIAWFIAAAVAFGVLAFLFDSLGRRQFLRSPDRFFPRRVWIRRLIALVFTAAFVAAIIPGALVFFTAFSAVPAALGEIAGQSIAEAELTDYRKGCAASRHHCMQLKKSGENVAKGYVLDDSQSHIAIFDVDLQRGRTLPREGLEVVAVREPGLKPNGK